MTLKLRSILFVECLACVIMMGATASASHSHAEYSFDSFSPLPWTPDRLNVPSPFGGSYLGDIAVSESFHAFIMDALPAGGDYETALSPRLVEVTYGIVPRWRYADQFEDDVVTSRVIGNGIAYEADVVNHGGYFTASTYVILRQSPSVRGADLHLSFDIEPVLGRHTEITAWGLDDVVINWSRVLPEPSSSGSACFLLTMLILRYRRHLSLR
jgi:hypothetical protein